VRFEDVIDRIAGSSLNDWWTISCWGAFSGPSYRDRLAFYEVYEGDKNTLHVESQPNVGVYKPDISITIAWGLHSNNDFKEAWANQFPDPQASSSFLDVFYNNALIFRNTYVMVDGGRANLPLPRVERDKEGNRTAALTVPRREHDLIRLVDSLTHKSDFDRYFRQAGLTIINEEWPHGLF
jgi:hypothetical protein